MTNEALELARILMYLFCAFGAIYLGVIFRRTLLGLIGCSLVFAARVITLFLQMLHPELARETTNYISTPVLVITLLLIYINLVSARKQ